MSEFVRYAGVWPHWQSCADPLENGYDPVKVERIYRDRLKDVLAQNERLQARVQALEAHILSLGHGFDYIEPRNLEKSSGDVAVHSPTSKATGTDVA